MMHGSFVCYFFSNRNLQTQQKLKNQLRDFLKTDANGVEMKVWEAPVFVFNYAFDNVCATFYDRYPNTYAKHIISEDVLSREITKDRIITRKLIVKKGASFLKSVPRWLARYVSLQYMPTLEESVYDRDTRTLTTYTRNVSWCNVLHMDELCVYKPQELTRTELFRQLRVSVDYGHVSSFAERFLVLAFKKSVKKTMEGYLEKLQERFGPSSVSATSISSSNTASVISLSDTIRQKKFELDKM